MRTRPNPPGKDNLLGLAITLDGKGFDDVEDVMNTLAGSRR
jgi:hypothetical protein